MQQHLPFPAFAVAAAIAAALLAARIAPAPAGAGETSGRADAAASPDATAQARYDAARAAYERGHYAAAFDAFAALGDDGHCQAARTALHMARYGRLVYAATYTLPVDRIARWRTSPCQEPLAVR